MTILESKRLLECFQKDFAQLRCKEESFTIVECEKELISIAYDRLLTLSRNESGLNIHLKNGVVYHIPKLQSAPCKLIMNKENIQMLM